MAAYVRCRRGWCVSFFCHLIRPAGKREELPSYSTNNILMSKWWDYTVFLAVICTLSSDFWFSYINQVLVLHNQNIITWVITDERWQCSLQMWSLHEINTVSGISVSDCSPSRAVTGTATFKWFLHLAPASTKHRHHSHPRESALEPVCLSLPLQRSLLQRAGGAWTSAMKSQGSRGGGLSGKLTAKINRDSQVPEAALTSAAPVKGQEMRGSDRPLHPITTSSPLLGWLQTCYQGLQEAHVTFDSYFQSKAL